MELKVILELLELRIYLVLGLFGKENISDKKMGNEIKEDKYTRSCAESNMKPTLRDFKATAHRSLNVEHLFYRAHLASESIGSVIRLQVEASLCRNSIHSLSHDCSLRRQVDPWRLVVHVHFHISSLLSSLCW